MHAGTADRDERATSGAGHWPPITPATSLRPPPATFPVVPRPAAVARLDSSTSRQVTLVCAPAGAGKTVLAAAWAATAPGAVWLGLAREDAHRGVFWWHLLEALSSRLPVPDGWDRPSGPDDGPGSALDGLALVLERDGGRTTVVLDAVEEVTDDATLADLDRLMTLAGDRLRVVLLARARPALPLHRYRLEGRLAELGPDDLRLDADAVASVLDQHALHAPGHVVRELTRATEGWAAGARLAAMALQDLGPSSPSGPTEEQARASLAPDSLLGDYLRAEVVRPLTVDDRTALRRLSLVDGFDPELASVLTGRQEDAGSLADLAHRVPFLRREPAASAHFRLHPLLRDVLHASYVAERPDEVRDLHRRAADWLTGCARPVDAVEQLVRAGELVEAVRVVAESGALAEMLLPTASGMRLTRLLAGATEVDTAPGALVAAALALASGDHAAARTRLAAVPDETRDATAPSAALVRATLAAAAGDSAGTLDATAEARELYRETGGPPSAASALLLVQDASARLSSGDLDAAAELLGDALRQLPDDGVVGPRLDCLGRLALVEALRGYLTHAVEVTGTAEGLAAEGGAAVPAPAAGHLARAWVATERQELSRALHWLGKAARHEDLAHDPVLEPVSVLVRARLMRDRGETSMARRLLADDPPGAGWTRTERDLERRGLGLAAPTSSEATSSRRTGRRAVVRTPSARVGLMLREAERRSLRTGGDADRDLVLDALELAEPERLRRPFAHAGPAVRALMRTDAQVATRAAWLAPVDVVDAEAAAPGPDTAATVDLTDRELEVLQHLADLLSTQEIGSAMFISVNTVRTHVRHILHKLAVTRRNEAVRRARVLQLI
ncbi:hypothetical protein EKO23_05035 [Nocardioides guangzhouensis]|uniref:HTH luxR-type domain-containing protein n=1 Tax=Nocardioides guangzhouensis TaxID=2497878 RepID=A0A4Q4ZJR2_9ACTN|nr:LuxR C-terminal-related transcriptional regulator [Nocardioides guangzhouensis]RYP87756.1 hypothetical protein EKO23_05035 [Nocardioides guangzhouensis]